MRRTVTATVTALILTSLALTGCGGGDDNGGGEPEPSTSGGSGMTEPEPEGTAGTVCDYLSEADAQSIVSGVEFEVASPNRCTYRHPDTPDYIYVQVDEGYDTARVVMLNGGSEPWMPLADIDGAQIVTQAGAPNKTITKVAADSNGFGMHVAVQANEGESEALAISAAQMVLPRL